MSKIIAKLQSPIDKVSGHKYTGFTIKAPFINFSFAPTIFTAPNGAQRVEKVFSPRCADFETFKKSFKILFD